MVDRELLFSLVEARICLVDLCVALRMQAVEQSLKLHQGLPVGAVWLLFSLAKQLKLIKALGSSTPAKLALWQVIARIIDQGSRLSAVRLAGSHAACDVLGLESFNEDDLYANLDWLCANQADIERRLFRRLYPKKKPFLASI